MESEDQLSLTFGALADPTRRAILARLADRELTVNEIARPYAMSVQAVSKHLKVLERAGLIKRGREAQWRPSRLDPAPLNAASEWIQQYRELATDRMDRLNAEIKKLHTQGELSS
jgi:DNA-binding transcriptional ArsR family regulator